MPSLFFGMLSNVGVPQDEKKVRATTGEYELNAPPAEQDGMPDRNEVVTDKNPDLAGLVNRQKGSMWVAPVKSAPFWETRANVADEHNAIVDRQVASSGSAAARESAGEFGHGTMAYAIGIEPVGDLTDGGKMGNEYFVRNDRIIQPTSDNTMMTVPPGYDQSTKGRVAATGKEDTRKAAQAALFNTWWNEGN